MNSLATLEKAFSVTAAPSGPPPSSVPTAGTTTEYYQRRLKSLNAALSGKYAHCLDGGHGYPSDSEAAMAVVAAMVARHFTDGEIWHTIEGSALFVSRVAKKGEKHARELFQAEVIKARRDVRPFTSDPGDEPSVKHAAPTSISADAVDPAVFAEDETGDSEAPQERLELPQGNGFIAKYVRHAARRTDAPLEAHELMAVGVLSALAGPQPRLPIATSPRGWNLCIWCMYIVNSTVGRKSTVLRGAREIIVEILSPLAVIEWEGSPQGIIQKLMERDGQGTAFIRDEYSGLMAQMNRAGGHMAGLAQLFIRAFDGAVIENIRTKKKVKKDGPKVEDTDRVEHPYLPKLTASTWDSFVERATIDNVLDGFLPRFVFTIGAATPRPLPLLDASMQAEFDDLVATGWVFHRKASVTGFLDLDPKVLEMSWDIEQEFLEDARRSGRPDAAGAAMKRLSDSVLKVAALIAIDQAPPGTTPRVSPSHFNVAYEMGGRWKRSTLKLIDALGSTTFMRDTEAVLRTVYAHPAGIALRNLSRLHRRLRKRDFDEILESLQVREQIEIVTVPGIRGRPPQIAYPFGKVPRDDKASES